MKSFDFGKQLQIVMYNKRISTKQVAVLFDSTAQQFSRWKHSDDCKASNLIHICNELNMTVDEFINAEKE